ncbi:unnamed protein product [Sphacelaria rigidula]
MLAGEAKALHTTKRSSGVDVSDPALAEAWAKVQRDSDPQTDWCAFHHAEASTGSNNVMALLGCGSGGLAELCSALDESKVTYCALRLGTASAPRFHRLLAYSGRTALPAASCAINRPQCDGLDVDHEGVHMLDHPLVPRLEACCPTDKVCWGGCRRHEEGSRGSAEERSVRCF